MKTLHFHLTKQVLITLLLTVAVFTFVLLVGNVLKEILALLVTGQVGLGMVLQAVGLLIPYVMAYVLPFAMLTAVLLVFGRFSADQELTAVRASGMSLMSLVSPILLLSLMLCGVCAWVNLWVAPQCRAAYKNIILQLGTRSISSLITEDRFIEIPGVTLYIRKRDGEKLEDVSLYKLEGNQIRSRTSAQSGMILYDAESQVIRFELFDVVSVVRMDRDPEAEEQFIGPPPPEKPSDWMTGQAGSLLTDPIDLTELMKAERKPKLSEMTYWGLKEKRSDLESKGISVTPVRVQMHRQVAFSFACFAFTLVGIPLAIQAHRRETSIGVAMALLLLLLYYALLVAGEALNTKEHFRPHWLMWAPNALFQIVGVVLLKRASHG